MIVLIYQINYYKSIFMKKNMKNKAGIKKNDIITFREENLPYTVKSVKGRFAICTRNLDKKKDDSLLSYKVEMGGYLSKEYAFEDLKDEMIYTIIDFEEMKRSSNNLVFNIYDYNVQKDIDQCINDLLSGKCELSKRNQIELTHFKIDRTIIPKKNNFYFENEDAENAYTEEFFQDQMKSEGITEMTALEAVSIPFYRTDFIYCKISETCYEKKDCGKKCEDYDPTHGDRSKCKNLGQYCEFGNEITLRIK